MDNKNIRYIKLVNLLYFIIIILIAIFFGKERAIFVDGSNALYDIATKKILYYGENRISTTINYVFPLIATYLGCSLKTIVYSLAANYLVLPIAVFIFLRYKQVSIKYELTFLFTFSFLNFQTYFYPIHDYWTGFYLFFALYRIIDDDSLTLKPKTKQFLIFFFIVAIFFSHINTVLSLGFLFIYLFIDKRLDKTQFFRLCGFIVLIFLSKVFFFKSGYEGGFINSDNFKLSFLLDLKNSLVLKGFGPTLLTFNLNFLLLLVGFYILALIKKKFKLIAVFTFILLAVLFIIAYMFREFEYNVYTEGHFKSTMMVLSIIFINLFYDLFKEKIVVHIPIILAYTFSTVILIMGGNTFAKHYNFINETVQQFDKNVYLSDEIPEMCPLELVVLPRHSLIINTIENKKKNCLFGIINDEVFVHNIYGVWFKDNKESPPSHFTFSEEIAYLDADSVGIDMRQFNLIHTKNCIGHLKAIKQETGM